MTAAVGVPPTPVSPPPAGAVPREAAETEGSFPDVRNAQVQQKITRKTKKTSKRMQNDGQQMPTLG